jgi:hypothetical protein
MMSNIADSGSHKAATSMAPMPLNPTELLAGAKPRASPAGRIKLQVITSGT